MYPSLSCFDPLVQITDSFTAIQFQWRRGSRVIQGWVSLMFTTAENNSRDTLKCLLRSLSWGVWCRPRDASKCFSGRLTGCETLVLMAGSTNRQSNSHMSLYNFTTSSLTFHGNNWVQDHGWLYWRIWMLPPPAAAAQVEAALQPGVEFLLKATEETKFCFTSQCFFIVYWSLFCEVWRLVSVIGGRVQENRLDLVLTLVLFVI